MVNFLTESGNQIIFCGQAFRGLIVTFDQFTKVESIHLIGSFLQILEAPGYKFITKDFSSFNTKTAYGITPRLLNDFASAHHTTEALILANFISHYGIELPKEKPKQSDEQLNLF
jgi:hypothetical protein